MTIIVTRRRPVLILHLEAKYAKIDCKNEIYVKNWLRSTWTAKVNYGKKSTVKVNVGQRSGQRPGQRWRQQVPWQMTSADAVADDVSRWYGIWRHLGLTSAEEPWRVQTRAGAWRKLEARDGVWAILAAREGACQWRRDFWWRVEARGWSDEDEISQKGRSERFLSDGVICGLIGEAKAVVAARQWSLMYWSHGGGSGAAHNNGCRWHPRRQDCLRAVHQRIRAVALIPC